MPRSAGQGQLSFPEGISAVDVRRQLKGFWFRTRRSCHRGQERVTHWVSERASWLQLADRDLAQLISRLYQDTRAVPVATERELLDRLGDPGWHEWSPA